MSKARAGLSAGTRDRGFVLGLVALGLAAAGSACVRQIPLLGGLAFAAAGLVLALSTVLVPSRSFGAGPWAPPKREAWEPFFFAALALGLGALRFYKLSDLPAGARHHEGEMFGQILRLANMPYTPHVNDLDVLWPSMAFYQAMAAVKFLGLSLGALRLPAAILDYLCALAMYFLARRITSPYSAAVITVLFAGNVLMMSMGRNLFPGSLLLMGSVCTLYFLLKGIQDRRPLSFVLGGLGLGLCMHGFVPGRSYFMLFVAWLLLLAFFYPRVAPDWKLQSAFWAAALLAAAPVLLWAGTHWTHYWQYVAEHNPWGGQGPMAYVEGFFHTLPDYVRAFHVSGDPDPDTVIAFRPFLDLPSGLLFALGFFACAALAWRPLPSLLLGGLLLGLLPAIMGGGYASPQSRRSILAFPHVYLIAAMGLDQLRALLAPKLGPVRLAAALGVLGLACWAHGLDWRDYADYLSRPEVVGRMDHQAYLAGRAMREHPASQFRVSSSLVSDSEAAPLLPSVDLSSSLASGYENLLSFVPQDGKDLLFLMGGLDQGWMGLMTRVFPSARVTTDAVADLPLGEDLHSDPADPSVFLVQAEVPASEAGALRGLLSRGPGGDPRKVDAFDGSFGERYRGKRLELFGRLVGDRVATELQGGVAWPGWSVRVDGRGLEPWRAEKLPAGVLRIEIDGRVPERAEGALPLSLQAPRAGGGDDDLVSEGRILAVDGPEVELSMTSGARSWGRPAELVRKDLVPLRRFFDPTELPVPFSVRMSFRFAVPEDGSYEFSENPYAPPVGVLRLDGAKAFEEPGQDPQQARVLPVTLRRGVPVQAVMDQVVPGDGAVALGRSMALYVRRTGDSQWQFLPYAWLRP